MTIATLTATSASAQVWSPPGLEVSRLSRLIAKESTTETFARSRPPGWSIDVVQPTLYLIHNSALPNSLNDGGLWAGRGMNVSATGGVSVAFSTTQLSFKGVVAPTWVQSQNLPFQFFADTTLSRSPFASPWHASPASADVPLRFGNRSWRQLESGESSLAVDVGAVSAGVSSASDWWGPGIRNALVLSDNAGGIPRAFVQTARPVRTTLGLITAKLILGTLTESPFFDTVSSNNFRSLSGLLVTLRPTFDPRLTLGFARTVYAASTNRLPSFSRGLDALTHWESVARASDTLANGATRQRADQLFSIFGDWLFAPAGVDVYAEWARTDPPRSLREWFIAPQSTRGLTIGMQMVRSLWNRVSFLRTQVEFTNLEQTAVFPDRPPMDYYTGRASAQGYTQRGQIIGAAIGPGGSSQFLGFDYLRGGWQAGLFLGRTRMENDALYRQPQNNAARHDVMIYSGFRGGVSAAGLALNGQLTVGRRLNYLFQNDAYNPGETPRSAVDVQNVTLEMRFSRP